MSRFKKHHIPFYAISLCIFCFDQITKLIVIRAMPLFFSFKLIPGFLFFTHIRNTGAAFGIFPGYILPLIIIGTIISSAILYFHFMVPEKDRFMQISLALILGGSLGNLFDRIFRGYVVDFIDFRFWPAFNIADIAVNLGIFFIVLSLALQKEKLA